MPKKDVQLNPIQEELRLMNECPLCTKKYPASKKNILERRQGAQLVHLNCSHCQNSVLAVIVISQIGMSSVGMVTDLSPADVKRLRERQAISEEELLDFHRLLSEDKNILKFTQFT